MATRIYLDVDGVINAFDGTGSTPPVWADWDTFDKKEVNGYLIKYSPELLNRLTMFIMFWEDVEVVWLTTWRDLAPTILSDALNFDAGKTFRVVSDGGEGVGYNPLGVYWSAHWWKADAAFNDLSASPVDHVIWLDDDLLMYSRAVEALSSAVPNTKFWTLPTDTNTGLTKRDVRMVDQWLNLLEKRRTPTVVRDQ